MSEGTADIFLINTFQPHLKYLPGPSQGLKIREGLVVLGGENVLPLVEVGLTDLSKTGGRT